MVLLIPYDPFEPFNNLVTAIKCKPSNQSEPNIFARFAIWD